MTLHGTVTGQKAPSIPILALGALAGSLLLTLSAKVSVPFYPVPMTFQTLVVIGLGLAFGPRLALAAVLSYLAQGAAGLPVFAGTPEKGLGLAYMTGPTGGYLVGFVLAAWTAGKLGENGRARRPFGALIAAVAATMMIYLPGLLWLGTFTGYGKALLAAGFWPFLAADAAKAALAALVFPASWAFISAKGGR